MRPLRHLGGGCVGGGLADGQAMCRRVYFLVLLAFTVILTVIVSSPTLICSLPSLAPDFLNAFACFVVSASLTVVFSPDFRAGTLIFPVSLSLPAFSTNGNCVAAHPCGCKHVTGTDVR